MTAAAIIGALCVFLGWLALRYVAGWLRAYHAAVDAHRDGGGL